MTERSSITPSLDRLDRLWTMTLLDGLKKRLSTFHNTGFCSLHRRFTQPLSITSRSSLFTDSGVAIYIFSPRNGLP